MYYKIASILLNTEQKGGAASDIFIAQPDNDKEALVGKLFVLAEIQSQGSDAAKILEFLIKNINFNYYQNEKVILKERIETISLESIFESALAKTNKDLAEFLAQEKIKISPYAFNISICVLYKNEIYFSGTGKNKNLLLYKEKTVIKHKGHAEPETEKIEYKISDVGETPENEALNINKLFSNVISGKIPVGGYFLVINEALSEYLSNKQLIKIVTKLSPAGAAEQIRNLLEQINSYVYFLGIIVKNTVVTNFSGEELKNRLEEEIEVDDYKPEITATEEKTEAIMTPSGIVNLKKLSKTISNKLKTSSPTAPAENKIGRGMFLLKEKIFFKKRVGFLSPEKIYAFMKKIGKLITAVPASVLKFFAKEKDSSLDEAAGNKTEDKLGSKSEADDTTPFWSGKKIKAILIIALIIAIIFAVNIYITDQRNKAAEKIKQFNALISQIEKNQNKIEADFIYGNKGEVADLFEQDKSLLAKIPQEEIAKREAVKALFDRQAQQAEKIQNINKVSGLKKIADFSNLTAAANPFNLLAADNLLYSADGKNDAIFKIDLKENIVTAIYKLGIASSSALFYPTADQNGNIYYLNNDNIFTLGKTDQHAILKITLPSTADNLGGIKAYSDKLYVLDKSLGQIFRYARTDDGFTGQIKWLNQDADLSAAADIFIDGNVYVLFKDGHVDEYLKGKKQNLTLDNINPTITAANKLIVTPDYFYVLEIATKRLAIWSNKGAYLAQYIFTDLNNIKDFAVDDKGKQIYFLDGHGVYQMAIPVIK
jgi:hypothetical protein